MASTTPLIWFFVLSYAIAWSVWFLIAFMVPDLEASRGTFLTAPGAWAPTISALLVTAKYEGRAGLWELFAQIRRWRIGWRFFALAVFGPSVLGVCAILIHAGIGGETPTLAEIARGLDLPGELTSLLFAFPIVFLVLIVGGPLAEETGWRGFAQFRLQQRMGSGPAGLVIGLIWSLWHLPLIFVVPSGTGQIAPWFYIPFVTLLGVIFAWGYNRTHCSVFFTILLHAGGNTFFAYRLVTASGPLLLGIALIITLVLAVLAFRSMRGKPPQPARV